jgi:hypothetical protein
MTIIFLLWIGRFLRLALLPFFGRLRGAHLFRMRVRGRSPLRFVRREPGYLFRNAPNASPRGFAFIVERRVALGLLLWITAPF